MVLATVTLIKQGDRYLILERSSKDRAFPSLFCLPGGKVEKDESILEGAIREVEEETSLIVNPDDLTYMETLDSGNWKIAFFRTDNFEGSVEISNEHVSYRWVAKEELPLYKFPPMTLEILNKYL